MISWKNLDRNYLLCIAVMAAFVLFPLFTPTFYLNVAILVFYFGALGSAWNIIGGMGGQLSLGHAAFVGIGAYTSTILFVKLGVPPVLGIFAGAALSALVAAFIGYLCFRLRGPYFTLGTIALGEILLIMCNYWRSLTNGSMGLSLPAKYGFWNIIYQQLMSYYYLLMIFMVLCFFVGWYVKNSRLGAYLTAIKEDEVAAESLGIDTFRMKMKAMLISAVLSSMGGTLYAQYIRYIDPETTFDLMTSINMALVAMIGGKGTVAGPIVGALIIVPVNELLRFWLGGSFEGLSYIIYAVIVIAVAVLMPEGVLTGVQRLSRRRKLATH
jgi:branched-chain amino acid transport system permease protein